MTNKVITISRQFGSGGRTIGKKVAEKLGIPYYDKELVDQVAKESGFSHEFIEEIGEQMYRLDRMMQQLERSGILAKCKAVLVGHFTDMLGQKHFGIWDPCDIIAAYVRPLGIPVVFGIPAGHEDPNVALYMGREVAVTVNDAGASIEF